MVVLYAPRAERDLQSIWGYTFERWGEAQADKYIQSIATLCEDLASGTAKALAATHVRAGYFKRSSGSHVIFFRRLSTTRIVVIRVLHQSMDFERHL